MQIVRFNWPWNVKNTQTTAYFFSANCYKNKEAVEPQTQKQQLNENEKKIKSFINTLKCENMNNFIF